MNDNTISGGLNILMVFMFFVENFTYLQCKFGNSSAISIVMLTNQDLPVKVDVSDRRHACFQSKFLHNSTQNDGNNTRSQYVQHNGMEFREVIVGSSDEESVSSQETQRGADENWDRIERRYNNQFHVHEFRLQRGWRFIYERNPEYFAEDIANICAGYGPNSITAIRLCADVIDETTGEVREKVRIRLEYTLFHHLDDLKDMIFDLIISNMAPMWIRVEDFETSDTAVGKFVWYDLSFFDVCIQRKPRTPLHATMIVGEGEVHPGVWVKRISTKDHQIEYGPKDCAIMCMNEATGKRIKPQDVKGVIWPNSPHPDKLDMHRKRHLKALSSIYGIGITLYLIDDYDKLVIGNTHNSVQLVKVGKVVGVLDRFEQMPETDDTSKHSEGYFDLETVGEVQRVYAYSMRTPYGSCTVADGDIDGVEDELVNDVYVILNKMPEKESLIMYSWNGSRFDSYIMLRILAGQDRFRLDGIIINSGNELLTFRVRLGDGSGSIVFRDPCKLFPDTLEGAASILGLGMEKTKGMDHDEVERVFISKENWQEYINNHREEVCKYVKQDVRMLEGVVNGIRSLYSHNKEYALPLRVCLTRSMASTMLWMKTLPKEVRDQVRGLHIDPYTDIKFQGMRYMDIMDHAVGGRVQCVQRGEFENVGAIDVKSMYPYVCSKFEYPCGEMSFVGDYAPDKLGVYYVLIKKQSKPMVIPHRKNRQDAYDWEYDKPFFKWVTSVDLEQIDDYVVFHGIVWSDRTNSFFKSYMDSLYQLRKMASSKALNLHWKIFMNALTGSLFQAALRDFTLIMRKDEFEGTMKKYSEVIHVLSVEDLNDDDLIVVIFRPVKLPRGSPKIQMQKDFCKNAITSKPWILTMFIYSYSRRDLRDMWIEIESNGRSRVLYCDTDSLLFTHCDLVEIKTGSEMGDWEVEHWDTKACLHASKVYAVGDKVRIKGVSIASQSLICDEEVDIPVFDRFEDASRFFMAGKDTAVKPGYEHVKALVDGKQVYFMSWHMEKSKTEGVIKRYRIKHLN